MNPSHHIVLALVCLILGSVVGSFLNVWPIDPHWPGVYARGRVARAVGRRSGPRRGTAGFGLVDLGGKCRHCRSTISPRYPIVELMVGLLFAAAYLAGVALAPGDAWVDADPFGVLAVLLTSASDLSYRGRCAHGS